MELAASMQNPFGWDIVDIRIAPIATRLHDETKMVDSLITGAQPGVAAATNHKRRASMTPPGVNPVTKRKYTFEAGFGHL